MRNATQRELTATLGTVGATHVRFLFGFPFALVFLPGAVRDWRGAAEPPAIFWPWVFDGALRAVRRHRADARRHERPFVRGQLCLHQDRAGQVALFGLIFLGDVVTLADGASRS